MEIKLDNDCYPEGLLKIDKYLRSKGYYQIKSGKIENGFVKDVVIYIEEGNNQIETKRRVSDLTDFLTEFNFLK